MDKFKPCPFCGGTDIRTSTDDGCHWEQCKKCESTGPTGFKYGEDDSLSWNSRSVKAFDEAAEREAATEAYKDSGMISEWPVFLAGYLACARLKAGQPS